MPIRVLAVCGSSREESNLEQLLAVAADAAREAGAEDAEAFADAYMLLHEGTLVMRQVMNC